MRILYAEDERDLNDLVTRRLVAEGYGVDSCLDGQQAWDYLQAADYDAAILDITQAEGELPCEYSMQRTSGI